MSSGRPREAPTTTRPRVRKLMVYGLTLILYGSSSAGAESCAEHLIAKSIAAGEIADLKDCANRVVSPVFIERLLTSKTIPRTGVRIVGGEVRSEVGWQNIEVSYEVRLESFRLSEDVDISR